MASDDITRLRLGRITKYVHIKVVEAFCVNLWHTSYLGVSRDAASKSAVCQDEKGLQMPQTGEIKDGRFHWNKHFNIHIFFLLKMIETWKKNIYLYVYRHGESIAKRSLAMKCI